MSVEDIAVVGAGSYGTCLAMLFGKAGHRVSFWARKPEVAAEIAAKRETPYLPGHALPSNVVVTSDLEAAVRGKRFIIGVTPSHGIRDVLGRAAAWLDPDAVMINASKGLDEATLQTIDALYAELLPARIATRATYLSGPTFANEIAKGDPAAIVLAGRDAESTKLAQGALGTLHFRIYTTDDVVGVLVGGALKNVVAIAAGVSDGLGFGSNARVALITRGLAEITRVGTALGAHALTFAGLSGMGDLVLTCSGDASRNRRVGLALGQGRTMADILGEMKMVAEGVKTTKVAYQLAKKLGVDAPIIDVMYAILHDNVPVRDAIGQLLSRIPKGERD
jgi:glycerol-3-phosphate dehydrogenase (NAD(P)+)|nr:NAD(P)H-dependent glycerol-3-phosphate dehydrogenase [Kofleriaceae bacterium]